MYKSLCGPQSSFPRDGLSPLSDGFYFTPAPVFADHLNPFSIHPTLFTAILWPVKLPGPLALQMMSNPWPFPQPPPTLPPHSFSKRSPDMISSHFVLRTRQNEAQFPHVWDSCKNVRNLNVLPLTTAPSEFHGQTVISHSEMTQGCFHAGTINFYKLFIS